MLSKIIVLSEISVLHKQIKFFTDGRSLILGKEMVTTKWQVFSVFFFFKQIFKNINNSFIMNE